MLAETRAQITYSLARNVIERMVPSVPLIVRPNATLNSAEHQDHHERDFHESANHFYSVYQATEDSETRADAFIGLAQQLINLGSLRQAREFLQKASNELIDPLGWKRKLLIRAKLYEKLGWIADYELGYYESLDYFTQASGLVEAIPFDEHNVPEKQLLSTCAHFKGRARFGLAAMGIEREKNTHLAIKDFNDAMFLDRKVRGDRADETVGYGYMWLARCLLLLGEIVPARYKADEGKEHFLSHIQRVPKSGIMAHYYLTEGVINLHEGQIVEARSNFEEAIRIRTKVEQYPKGLADAYLGIAKVSWEEYKPNFLPALHYFGEAVKADPHTVLRSTLAE